MSISFDIREGDQNQQFTLYRSDKIIIFKIIANVCKYMEKLQPSYIASGNVNGGGSLKTVW